MYSVFSPAHPIPSQQDHGGEGVLLSVVSMLTTHATINNDFQITPVKCGFNTVRLHWSKTGICSVFNLGETVGHIIFTVLMRKSEKQWKIFKDCLENLLREVPRVIRLFLGAAPLRKA